MKLNKLANPYSIFAVSWMLCLCLYTLGWANIFPKITSSLFVFILFFVVLFATSGLFFSKYTKGLNHYAGNILNYKVLLLLNTLFWIPNFLYTGIPFFNGVRDDAWGIPTFKVFVITFNNFLSVYGFYLFLKTGKKSYFLGILYCFMFSILLISRGNIMMCISSMFFLWINLKAPVINFKVLVILISFLCGVMFAFGYAGNLRTIKGIVAVDPKFDDTYNSDVILSIGDASDSFKENVVPNEFFWSYLYITSPLSNLQYDINREDVPTTVDNLVSVGINEILLDALSKRVNDVLGRTAKKPALLIEQLTVCTSLAGSYTYAGWGGMIMYMLIFWMLPFGYFLLIRKNPLGIIGISILCTMYFFSIFDNMLILGGLTPQLLFPMIFNFVSKVNWLNQS